MKRQAVVFQKHNTYYVAMSADGLLHKIKGQPPNGADVGERIQIASKKTRNLRYLALVASVLLIVTGTLLYWPALTSVEKYHFALDINPSFEFVVDQDANLLEVYAHNAVAAEILDNIDIPPGSGFYATLALILDYAEQLGMLTEEINEVYLSYSGEMPVDMDRIIYAFENRNKFFAINLLTLDPSFFGLDKSPLRAYLEKTLQEQGQEFDEEDFAAQLEKHLSSVVSEKMFVSTEVNDLMINYFVNNYQVSSALIQKMLAAGYDYEEIALVLEVAKYDNVKASSLFAELLGKKADPFEYFKGHPAFKVLSEAAEDVVKEMLKPEVAIALEYLAHVFAVSPKTLELLWNEGYDLDELTELLVISDFAGVSLDQVLGVYLESEKDLDTTLYHYGFTESHFKRIYDPLEDKLDNVKDDAEAHVIYWLANEFNLNRYDIIEVIALGNDVDELLEVIAIMQLSGKSLPDLIELLIFFENDIDDIIEHLGLDEDDVEDYAEALEDILKDLRDKYDDDDDDDEDDRSKIDYEIDIALEYLGHLYSESHQKLLGLWQQGYDMEELAKLVILSDITDRSLEELSDIYKANGKDFDRLRRRFDVSENYFKRLYEDLEEKLDNVEDDADPFVINWLVNRFSLNRYQIIDVIALGNDVDELLEVIAIMQLSGKSLPDLIELLILFENDIDDIAEHLGLDEDDVEDYAEELEAMLYPNNGNSDDDDDDDDDD